MISFDRTIETVIEPAELWRLVKQAFENTAESPIWPVELEEKEPVTLAEGAVVEATYKVGPIKARPRYRITAFDEEARRFSYAAASFHPLRGGATVEVLSRGEKSALRWYGDYRANWHPLAPGAVLFVKFYFLEHFFARLEEKIGLYGQVWTARKHGARPEVTGGARG